MERREIVRRAIEFESPPRLPFFIGNFWTERLSSPSEQFPNDVCDCWEMDRQVAGWFFDNAAEDDWGCGWQRTHVNNMGQVVHHPIDHWDKLHSYHPPDPRHPFYFERIEDTLGQADDRYVVLTSHFNLIERLHMLRGFEQTLVDFYTEPDKVHYLLDKILDFKIEHIAEAARRFGDRVHGIFLTDDWGTQQGPFVSPAVFNEFFFERYRWLFEAIHGHGWHAILHSCGRVNDLVPSFIDAGVDVLNLQQPRAYGIDDFGERFAGKVCFLTTVDIQATLPRADRDEVVDEARQLVAKWSVPEGGFIVFNYGDSEAIGTTDETTEAMFRAFHDLSTYWSDAAATP